MWTILGMLILIIILAIIGVIVTEKTDNKYKVLFTGMAISTIILSVLGCRFIKPKLNEYETKVNELTTELYESYNVRDSLEQELVSDVLKEDK